MGVVQDVDRPHFLDACSCAAAGFELGDVNQVEHEVVELLGFLRGAGSKIDLQRAQFAGDGLGRGCRGRDVDVRMGSRSFCEATERKRI